MQQPNIIQNETRTIISYITQEVIERFVHGKNINFIVFIKTFELLHKPSFRIYSCITAYPSHRSVFSFASKRVVFESVITVRYVLISISYQLDRLYYIG